MTLSITTELAWGNSVEDETLDDLISMIKDRVPSVKLRERPEYKGAGGWPVFTIEFADEDIELIASVFELSTEEFVEAYTVEA